jgi:hypothetical protein
MTVLTSAEIEAVRFHLDYGNISVGGYPYTPEGYFDLSTNGFFWFTFFFNGHEFNDTNFYRLSERRQ